ncbi:hypothetical protein ACED96_15495 [Clostridium thermobutyricum]
MDLKDIFIKYDYLKYRNGLNEMEEELKELENSKYSIKTCDFRPRVQENRITNDRIENISSRIERLKFKIKKNNDLVEGIDYLFTMILRDEFNFLYDLYINFDGKKEKYKKNKKINGWDFNRKFENAFEKVCNEINFILRINKIKFEYL